MRMRGAIVDEELTFQLYPMIVAPVESVTVDQEIVNGTVTEAPSAGPRGVGTSGALIAGRAIATIERTSATDANVRGAAPTRTGMIDSDRLMIPPSTSRRTGATPLDRFGQVVSFENATGSRRTAVGRLSAAA